MDNDAMDRLPEGMRVLAVDDNPICLKTMELTLRQCHYQVTTANRAYEAIKILRESRNMFDVVISDLKMPDMDGFHLLRLLGNEMVDLPVVLVSRDGDTELIKKGISYGACCYLKKPVAVEVLKTIWQHVFRRKKLNSKDQYSYQEKVCNGTREDEQEGISSTWSSEQYKKGKRKRKEPTRNDEDEDEDTKLPTKNHRPELHDKFVDAYYFLERTRSEYSSSPKEIHELMNVEGLTRRHVASHLQKLRRHLREGKVSYRQRRDLDPWRKHAHSSAGLSSSYAYTPLRMLPSSTNSSAAPYSYSRMVQPGHPTSQNLCNSSNYVANPQLSVLKDQRQSLYQLQRRSSMISVGQYSAPNNGSSLATSFPHMVGNQSCLDSVYPNQFPPSNTSLRSHDHQLPPNNFQDVSSSAFSPPPLDAQQNMYYTQEQLWEDHRKQDYNNVDSSNPPSVDISTTTSGVEHPQNDVVCNTSLNSSLIEQHGGTSDITIVPAENFTPSMHTKIDHDKDFILEQPKLDYDGFESLNNQELDELKDYEILRDLGFN